MARNRARRPEARPLRLFVAIALPEDVRASVEAAFEPLRVRFPAARWVPRENLHITMKFLGSTWPRLSSWVAKSVGGVAAAHARFETRVLGVGAFPSSRRARVLWAGLDDGAGRMSELAGGLDEALAREFEPERRPFRPHLTVARSDPALALPPSFEETTLQSAPFAVERLVLFRSHLRRPAPVYEPIETFPLRSG